MKKTYLSPEIRVKSFLLENSIAAGSVVVGFDTETNGPVEVVEYEKEEYTVDLWF